MNRSLGLDLPEPGKRFGVQALLSEFPGLALAPDFADDQFVRADAVRMVGVLAFTTPERDDRPSLTWTYEIKLIAPHAFPNELPRVYSIDGQVPGTYHTNPTGKNSGPTGDLCLGAPLQLHEILREDPTLLGYVTSAVIPYLYRHRYTVLYPGNEPPSWGELDHGTLGLLAHYRERLGVDSYGACLTLMHQAAQIQQKKGRKVRCPCGSGRTLFDCHYKQMLYLRKTIGRSALMDAYRDLHLCGPPPPKDQERSDLQ